MTVPILSSEVHTETGKGKHNTNHKQMDGGKFPILQSGRVFVGESWTWEGGEFQVEGRATVNENFNAIQSSRNSDMAPKPVEAQTAANEAGQV